VSDVITDLRAKQAVKIAVARALLNAAAEAGRDLSEDEDKQYKAVTAEVDALDSMIVREQQVAEREAQLNMPTRSAVKPEASMVNSKTKPGDSEEKAVAYYVRTGDRSAIATRASNNTGMNITTAADGGNAVPTGHYNQIIARRDEMMLATKLGVRKIAGVGTTVNVPIDDEADGEFVTKSEMGDDNSTNVFDRDAPALGTVAMTLVKYTKKIELTDELLADEDSNLLAFISDFVGRGLAKTHNSLMRGLAHAPRHRRLHSRIGQHVGFSLRRQPGRQHARPQPVGRAHLQYRLCWGPVGLGQVAAVWQLVLHGSARRAWPDRAA
jgi:HK97 family phage major capsid protein